MTHVRVFRELTLVTNLSNLSKHVIEFRNYYSEKDLFLNVFTEFTEFDEKNICH